jgi:anti-anti-sigma factor
MHLTHQKRGKYLLVEAAGRLDASWSDYFADSMLDHIRQGHHHLVIDGSRLTFLSSAGIRSFTIVYKALLKVKGELLLIHATEFVSSTLTTTGFGSWLADSAPEDMPSAESSDTTAKSHSFEAYLVKKDATLSLSVPAGWIPWQKAGSSDAKSLHFGKHHFALGIGSTSHHFNEARSRFGEFLAVAGHVVYQPPQEGEHPDFLLAEKDFIPEMLCLQALFCSGNMSHLLRFSQTHNQSCFSLGEIAETVLQHTSSDLAGFVLLGEIDGLVGSCLVQSPGLFNDDQPPSYPGITEWLSFCGERLYASQQALIFGIACKSQTASSRLLSELISRPGLSLHAHAAVFPYQALQLGAINLHTSIQKFFNGPPPLALLHLVEDSRPVVGLGESTFLRGACWCAPINNPEELL